MQPSLCLNYDQKYDKRQFINAFKEIITLMAGRRHEMHQRQPNETLMLLEDTHHGAVAENHQSTDDEDKHELETRRRKFHN